MFALNSACAEPETSETIIRELAKERLRNSPYQALKGVSCDYVDSVLFLRGCLATYHLKQLAQEAVVGLAGVRCIDNQIQVETPIHRE